MSKPQQQTLFGHPVGLYTLFFAEMWERFSYYGMRALLILYMIKGFLGYGDRDANAVYGAYTALVYMTPFFGGMIADRILGARMTVVIGGLLMAAGHLLMTIQTDWVFFTALGFLIAGNGFFKPNISTIVGTLYPPGSPKRDGGFTIFYIGINLGAAMAPLLCGYIGETYGWHKGFGLATIGMLVGVAIFVAPTILTQALIFCAAAAAAFGLFFYHPDDFVATLVNVFVGIALMISGSVAVWALARGGLPPDAGGPPAERAPQLRKNLILVLIGTALVLPILVMLVSGMTVIPGIDKGVTLIPESFVESLQESSSRLVKGLASILEEASRPAGIVLIIAGLGALSYLGAETFRLQKVARERMFVVFILTFFSLLFWSFFEQAGSSLNNFTDRNIDRVTEARTIGPEDVGTSVTLRLLVDPATEEQANLTLLTQEYLGQENGAPGFKDRIERAIRAQEEGKESARSAEEIDEIVNQVVQGDALNFSAFTYLREAAKAEDATEEDQVIHWQFTASNEGLGFGGSEVPASVFQAVNPIYILVFGLVFTALWGFLGDRGLEPSTPVKFALGLLQLGLGYACIWFGATSCDGNGMVAATWLLAMYLLQTTGELCLSPVGLSMVTKLSPTRLVSTVMGTWFLATAFSQFLAAMLAQFAAVEDGGAIPVPIETVSLYGDLYKMIALMAIASGVFCLVLSPILKRWMHEDKPAEE